MTKEEFLELATKIKYPRLDHIYVGDNGFVLHFRSKPSPGTPQVAVGTDGCIIVEHSRACNYQSMNDTQLLAVIYDTVASFEVHEASEWFQYNECAPFHSHVLQDAGIDVDSCVAPRLKVIDLRFVETYHRLDAMTRENLKASEMQVIEFSGFNLLKRLAIALCPSIW